MADALDKLGNPAAVILPQIIAKAHRDFSPWLENRKNARQIGYRLEACGYVPHRNRGPKDGLWPLDGVRRAIYVRREKSMVDRESAVAKFIKAFNEAGQNRKRRNSREMLDDISTKSVSVPLFKIGEVGDHICF